MPNFASLSLPSELNYTYLDSYMYTIIYTTQHAYNVHFPRGKRLSKYYRHSMCCEILYNTQTMCLMSTQIVYKVAFRRLFIICVVKSERTRQRGICANLLTHFYVYIVYITLIIYRPNVEQSSWNFRLKKTYNCILEKNRYNNY